MSNQYGIAGETFVYAAGNALARLSGLLLFPVYAKSLSASDYVTQNLAITTALLVALAASFGMDAAYGRLFFEQNADGRRQLARTWGIFALTCSIPIIVVGALASGWLAQLTIGSGDHGPVIAWALAGTSMQVLQRQPQLTLRLLRKPGRFVVATFSSAFAQLGLGVLFVWFLDLGAVGAAMAFCLGSAVGLIASVAMSGWIWSGRFSSRLLRGMLAFGLPLVPAGLANWAVEYLGRFLLRHNAGAEETAVFVVAAQIAGILGLVFYGFQMAWGPYAFSLMQDRESAAIIFARVTRWVCLVGGVAVLSIALFGREMVLVLTKPEYAPASAAIPWIALSLLLWTLMYITSLGYQLAKRSHHQMWSMLLGVTLVILAGPNMASRYGALGIALLTTASYAVAIGYSVIASQRYLRVPYAWPRLLSWFLLLICMAILFSSFWRIVPPSNVLSLNVALSLLTRLGVLLAATIVGISWLLEPSERRKIRSIIFRDTSVNGRQSI